MRTQPKTVSLVAICALAWFALPAHAQEKPAVAPKPSEPIRITPPKAGADDPKAHGDEAVEQDPHKEMERLFGVVERKLVKVNRLLEDASAGGSRRDGDARSEMKNAVEAIDKLLRDTQSNSRDAVAGIDKILEIASEQHSGGTCQSEKTGGLCKNPGNKPGSSGAPKNGQGGQPAGEPQNGSQTSPLDRQGGVTTQREATPKAPDQKKPGGQEPNGPKTAQQPNGPPKDNRAQPSGSENVPAGPPPALPTEVVNSSSSSADRWGDLPEHARDVFRMQGGGDMPTRYREWIDAYYKRLNKQP